MAYYNVPDLTIDALTLYIHVFSLRKDTTAIFLFGLFVKHFQLLGRPLLLSTKLSNASRLTELSIERLSTFRLRT
jgi:hypothetical protein